MQGQRYCRTTYVRTSPGPPAIPRSAHNLEAQSHAFYRVRACPIVSPCPSSFTRFPDKLDDPLSYDGSGNSKLPRVLTLSRVTSSIENCIRAGVAQW